MEVGANLCAGMDLPRDCPAMSGMMHSTSSRGRSAWGSSQMIRRFLVFNAQNVKKHAKMANNPRKTQNTHARVLEVVK